MADPTRPAATLIPGPDYDPDREAYGLDIPCPDRDPGKILDDKPSAIDARLWEGKFDQYGRLAEHRITPRLTKGKLADRYVALRERALREDGSDWFQFGYGAPGYGGEGSLTANYVPLIPGPATRQQYWTDYFQSSAKCFEAYHHQGIARRAVNAMVQFPLGRGVSARVKNKQASAVWDAFWEGNRMDERIREITRDLSIFGEQFLRYFPARRGDPRGLILRSLDPATIYEIVTDQEDIETVFFYHQQYQTASQMFSPPQGNQAPQGRTPTGVTLYIIRQIDAGEIDHYRINRVSSEKRGRSDLFPALGDLKRLRDLMTSKVIAADVQNRVMAVLTADGTPADIARLIASIFPGNQPPPPASVVGLNKQVTLEPFQYAKSEGTKDHVYDELVNLIAVATGIAKEYLGVTSDGATRANALVATEPTTKVFDERQRFIEQLLHDMADRVFNAAGIAGASAEIEFIFPSIAQEDRSALLSDLETSEANQWISKQTAASTAAQELGITTFDFAVEQKLVAGEFADANDTEDGEDGKPKQGDGVIRRPAIRAVSRQAVKLDPTKAQSSMDDEPPGLLVPVDPATAAAAAVDPGAPAPSAPGAPAPKTTGGMPADQNPQAAAGKAKLTRQASERLVVDRDTLGTLLREAYAAGRAPRRRPDDPAFKAHAQEFHAQTAQNLDRLLDDVSAGLAVK